jgi:hypothetical protein
MHFTSRGIGTSTPAAMSSENCSVQSSRASGRLERGVEHVYPDECEPPHGAGDDEQPLAEGISSLA